MSDIALYYWSRVVLGFLSGAAIFGHVAKPAQTLQREFLESSILKYKYFLPSFCDYWNSSEDHAVVREMTETIRSSWGTFAEGVCRSAGLRCFTADAILLSVPIMTKQSFSTKKLPVRTFSGSLFCLLFCPLVWALLHKSNLKAEVVL